MLLLQIILFTAWVWIPLLLLWLYVRSSKSKPSVPDTTRDQQWLEYLTSFQSVVRTTKEKALIHHLVEGRAAEELYQNPAIPAVDSDEIPADEAVVPAMATIASQSQVAVKPKTPIDNTILLLYFGAFLLVASVGLFVAISGLSGIMRTTIVGLTAAVLYVGGIWLYSVNKKLAQAGISFVGSGMIIAPLTGVAWYNLVSEQTLAGPIWLLTSLACIVLYIYAFSRIKNDFISYLLIGSFVSSIESAVLTLNIPTYGYAWGLLLVGLLLAVFQRLRGSTSTFDTASRTSSQLLVPLSVLGSIILLPEYGSLQLASTLALAGVYYGLYAWWQPASRSTMGVAAQSSLISAVASATYATQESFTSVGIALTMIATLYCAGIATTKRETTKTYQLINVAAIVSMVSIAATLTGSWSLVAAFAIAALLGITIWLKYSDKQALDISGGIVILLPIIIGQVAFTIEYGSLTQLCFSLISTVLLGGLVALCSLRASFKQYLSSASALYIIATLGVLIPAVAHSLTATSLVTVGIVLSFVGLRWLSKDTDWLAISGIIALVPLSYAFLTYGVESTSFTLGVAAALAWNIGVSLVTRHALVRWLVVGCILIAPVALGEGGLGFTWGAAGYAGGYMLAMISCIAARAIARGKLLLSSKVPISSYYTEASQAYVGGYITAALLAVFISLYDEQSRLITTLILGGIALAILAVMRVERNNQLAVCLPVLVQAALLSGLRPDSEDTVLIGITALLSTLAAIGTYLIADSWHKNKVTHDIRLVSVVLAYLGPLLAFSQEEPSILLPVSLLLAGAVTFIHNDSAKQDIKELSLAPCILAVHWFIYLADVTNIHVHTHILAVFLLGFALWRTDQNDPVGSQKYVQALFLAVTVPLVLAGMVSESGGIYGLVLIAEQVTFMIAGVTFGQRFLVRWGLWTALAAILFQLRGLGWAFLSLLAVIIIGVALYRLQKHPTDVNE